MIRCWGAGRVKSNKELGGKSSPESRDSSSWGVFGEARPNTPGGFWWLRRVFLSQEVRPGCWEREGRRNEKAVTAPRPAGDCPTQWVECSGPGSARPPARVRRGGARTRLPREKTEVGGWTISTSSFSRQGDYFLQVVTAKPEPLLGWHLFEHVLSP